MQKFNAIGIIPARLSSTRLPEKPLADIAGKPLIQYMWENAIQSVELDDVIIATDSEKICNVCQSFRAKCIMTPSELPSGTDRIAYAYKALNLSYDIIVNIQCDEPLLKPVLIDKLVSSLSQSEADVATLIKKINDFQDIANPSVVKVVIQKDGTALYFSRSTIPFIRDLKNIEWVNNNLHWKHIGIYAYKKEALIRFARLEPSELELAEKLEQLRLLQDGAKYLCIETDNELIGVDTHEDLERVRILLTSNP